MAEPRAFLRFDYDHNLTSKIVLVGRSMSSAYGVAAGVAMAKDKNLLVFGVYGDGADLSSTLPGGLARDRVIRWDCSNIAVAINQMISEGKNA